MYRGFCIYCVTVDRNEPLLQHTKSTAQTYLGVFLFCKHHFLFPAWRSCSPSFTLRFLWGRFYGQGNLDIKSACRSLTQRSSYIYAFVRRMIYLLAKSSWLLQHCRSVCLCQKSAQIVHDEIHVWHGKLCANQLKKKRTNTPLKQNEKTTVQLHRGFVFYSFKLPRRAMGSLASSILSSRPFKFFAVVIRIHIWPVGHFLFCSSIYFNSSISSSIDLFEGRYSVMLSLLSCYINWPFV